MRLSIALIFAVFLGCAGTPLRTTEDGLVIPRVVRSPINISTEPAYLGDGLSRRFVPPVEEAPGVTSWSFVTKAVRIAGEPASDVSDPALRQARRLLSWLGDAHRAEGCLASEIAAFASVHDVAVPDWVLEGMIAHCGVSAAAHQIYSRVFGSESTRLSEMLETEVWMLGHETTVSWPKESRIGVGLDPSHPDRFGWVAAASPLRFDQIQRTEFGGTAIDLGGTVQPGTTSLRSFILPDNGPPRRCLFTPTGRAEFRLRCVAEPEWTGWRIAVVGYRGDAAGSLEVLGSLIFTRGEPPTEVRAIARYLPGMTYAVLPATAQTVAAALNHAREERGLSSLRLHSAQSAELERLHPVLVSPFADPAHARLATHDVLAGHAMGTSFSHSHWSMTVAATIESDQVIETALSNPIVAAILLSEDADDLALSVMTEDGSTSVLFGLYAEFEYGVDELPLEEFFQRQVSDWIRASGGEVVPANTEALERLLSEARDFVYGGVDPRAVALVLAHDVAVECGERASVSYDEFFRVEDYEPIRTAAAPARVAFESRVVFVDVEGARVGTHGVFRIDCVPGSSPCCPEVELASIRTDPRGG